MLLLFLQILLTILKYLEEIDLFECRLVSKRWLTIINDNFRFQLVFRYIKLQPKVGPIATFLQEDTYKCFDTLNFFHTEPLLREEFREIDSFLEKLGSFIEKLYINTAVLDFYTLLKHFTKLKYLKVTCFDNNSLKEKFRLEKVKWLEVEFSDHDFEIKNLIHVVPNIEKLTLNYQNFTEILEVQDEELLYVKELINQDHSLIDIVCHNTFNLPVKVTSLWKFLNGDLPEKHYQHQNIRKLFMESKHFVHDLQILNDFTNLTQLTIKNLNVRCAYFHQKINLRNLRKLKVSISIDDIEYCSFCWSNFFQGINKLKTFSYENNQSLDKHFNETCLRELFQNHNRSVTELELIMPFYKLSSLNDCAKLRLLALKSFSIKGKLIFDVLDYRKYAELCPSLRYFFVSKQNRPNQVIDLLLRNIFPQLQEVCFARTEFVKDECYLLRYGEIPDSWLEQSNVEINVG